MSDRLEMRDFDEELKSEIRKCAKEDGLGENMSSWIRILVVKEIKKRAKKRTLKK